MPLVDRTQTKGDVVVAADELCRERPPRRSGVGAYATMTWNRPLTVDQVSLFDRPNSLDNVTSGELLFSDGTSITTGSLTNSGTQGLEVSFPSKTITWVKFPRDRRFQLDAERRLERDGHLEAVPTFPVERYVRRHGPSDYLDYQSYKPWLSHESRRAFTIATAGRKYTSGRD